jgi:hypothetical protein
MGAMKWCMVCLRVCVCVRSDVCAELVSRGASLAVLFVRAGALWRRVCGGVSGLAWWHGVTAVTTTALFAHYELRAQRRAAVRPPQREPAWSKILYIYNLYNIISSTRRLLLLLVPLLEIEIGVVRMMCRVQSTRGGSPHLGAIVLITPKMTRPDGTAGTEEVQRCAV